MFLAHISQVGTLQLPLTTSSSGVGERDIYDMILYQARTTPHHGIHREYGGRKIDCGSIIGTNQSDVQELRG